MGSKQIRELVIEEAIGEVTGREVEVTIIEAGFGNPVHKHYYGADMLREAAPRFANTQVYADHEHDVSAQRKRGGVRSTKDLVAVITEAWWDEAAQAVKGKATILRDWVMEIVRAKPDVLGLSLAGSAGRIRSGVISGAPANIVESIAKIKSVDLVTQAGAGGKIHRILESLMQEEADMALENITIADLKEHRSDLVESIEEAAKSAALAEAAPDLDNFVPKDDHEKAIAEAKTEAADAAVRATEERLTAAHKAEIQKRDNAETISEALASEDYADIPAKSKAAIAAALSESTFEDTEQDGKTVTAKDALLESLSGLVKEKREELAEASGSGKVRGMGGKSSDDGAGASAGKSTTPRHDALMESIGSVGDE